MAARKMSCQRTKIGRGGWRVKDGRRTEAEALEITIGSNVYRIWASEITDALQIETPGGAILKPYSAIVAIEPAEQKS